MTYFFVMSDVISVTSFLMSVIYYEKEWRKKTDVRVCQHGLL